MSDLVLGIAAAMGASTFYSLGIAFQALDAREVTHEAHLRLALLRRLVTRARWLFGTGLSILGFPLQVVALLLAPLVVVQPTLATGLLVLMLASQRLLGERAGRYEYLCVLAIVLGVLGLALTAPPRTDTHTSQQLTITLVLVGLGCASLLPYVLHTLYRSPAVVTMVGAGLAFAWSGVATKLASDDLSQGHLVPALVWVLSTAAASGVGVLSEMSALQSRPAIQVAPVVFVAQTVVPIVLAPLLLGESFAATPLDGIPLGASLALLLAGATMLVRSPLLLALMDGERVSQPSGSALSPSPASRATMRSSPATDALDPSSSTTSTSPARVGR
jgi:drug/metabolite transporter (DMT)-like permease